MTCRSGLCRSCNRMPGYIASTAINCMMVLKDDQIAPPAHPWYQELHKEMGTRQLRSQHPQMVNLVFPGCPLGRFNSKRELKGELA